MADGCLRLRSGCWVWGRAQRWRRLPGCERQVSQCRNGYRWGRRQVWLADALRDSGRQPDAVDAYKLAIMLAPWSFWGEEARRRYARLPNLLKGRP